MHQHLPKYALMTAAYAPVFAAVLGGIVKVEVEVEGEGESRIP
jgi:hypothetical protein